MVTAPLRLLYATRVRKPFTLIIVPALSLNTKCVGKVPLLESSHKVVGPTALEVPLECVPLELDILVNPVQPHLLSHVIVPLKQEWLDNNACAGWFIMLQTFWPSLHVQNWFARLQWNMK